MRRRAASTSTGTPLGGCRPKTSLLPIFTRDISVIGFVISLATATELADAAQAINRHLASNGFTTKAAGTMPLDKDR